MAYNEFKNIKFSYNINDFLKDLHGMTVEEKSKDICLDITSKI